MHVVDLHCDTLLKMWLSKGELAFANAPQLESNKAHLQQGGVKVQVFALFPPPDLSVEQKLSSVLAQMDYFHEDVLGKNPEMKQIKEWDDIDRLRDGEIGALLSLEGVDAIGEDLSMLTTLYQLGVRSVGLTWNHGNLAAGGALDKTATGLTSFGVKIVNFLNENQLFTDVSHLHEQAFWDVIELAAHPIASHSNARAILDHPRNLSDEQARALFAKGGLVHVFFSPAFVKEGRKAAIPDLIRHIEHFCGLGGERYIGIGSDFDGISMPERIEGLSHAGMMQNLLHELSRYYTDEQVRGFASENFMRNRPQKR